MSVVDFYDDNWDFVDCYGVDWDCVDCWYDADLDCVDKCLIMVDSCVLKLYRLKRHWRVEFLLNHNKYKYM